jgi:hypothetical protein
LQDMRERHVVGKHGGKNAVCFQRFQELVEIDDRAAREAAQ